MPAPEAVLKLVEKFRENRETYVSGSFNETQTRLEFIDPMFRALGWDMYNEAAYAEAYRDVIHEDAIKVGGATKAPDYCFRVGGARKFFLEAKKPGVNVKDEPGPAFQLRRYAWSAKLSLSILTDFEELAVYDCRLKPDHTDKASAGRIMYLTWEEYGERWDELAGIFGREAVLKGSFDRFAESAKKKKGTAEVDAAFLKDIESWRDLLARNIALRNPGISQRDLNFAVQLTIDRIIFLRICEDRGIESYGRLMQHLNGENVYQRMFKLFRDADDRYNSGLFHFMEETGRNTPPDAVTPGLAIDDKPLKDIIRGLYYPESPYEFAVLPAEILGQVYEQFLGKVIRLTAGHRAVVEDKPEVKKAGGVYYTPAYIVDYIVENTVGKLLGRPDTPVGQEAGDGPEKRDRSVPPTMKPKDVAKLHILDPACGSGSFLLRAYQKLLDWHKEYYVTDGPEKHKKEIFQIGRPDTPVGQAERDKSVPPTGDWRLTSAERKRILLNNIFGVDIDPQAVEVTKLSLLLKVLEGETEESLRQMKLIYKERALPDLSSNIKCGNSLIGPDFYQGKQLDLFDEEEIYRINAFDWGKEFPQVFGRPDTPVGQTARNGRPDTPVRPEARDRSVPPTVRNKDQVTTSSLLMRSHHLPHWQIGASMYFITFRSARGPLPLEALRQVKVNILHDHGKKYDLWFAVVMPDHVHLMMQPRQKEPGVWFDLAEILKGIKGVSSRRINQILGTTGKVWQEESFDRIVRDQKEFEEKLNYMYFNPTKRGLVDDPEKYEFIINTPEDLGQHRSGRPDTGRPDNGRPDTPVGPNTRNTDSDLLAGPKMQEKMTDKNVGQKARDRSVPPTNQGFDVVIGNPPYVRQEGLGADKEYFAQHFEAYHGMADLYTYFIEQGIKLLREGGVFGYIVSNKWMRANYGKPLRQWLKSRDITRIVDFGDLPVFQKATTYPCILIINKLKPGKAVSSCNVKTLDFADLAQYVNQNEYPIDLESLSPSGWSMAAGAEQKILEKIKSAGVPLGEYVKGKIYYGIKTGLNEAFVIDRKTRNKLIAEDKKSAEIIKPFLAGRDIKRYQPPESERYLIFTRRGIDIKQYPAIEKHLLQFKDRLMPKPKNWKGGEWKGRKPGTYKWHEVQDSIDYYQEFEKPKIICPAIVQRASYAFDKDGFYSNDKTTIIPTDDLYLLGILSSKAVDLILHSVSSTKQGGYYEYKPMYLAQLPIRPIDFSSKSEKAAHDRMVELVDRMLDLHKRLHDANNPHEKEVLQRQIEATDSEIDRLVYELYGLTKEEISIVEGKT